MVVWTKRSFVWLLRIRMGVTSTTVYPYRQIKNISPQSKNKMWQRLASFCFFFSSAKCGSWYTKGLNEQYLPLNLSTSKMLLLHFSWFLYLWEVNVFGIQKKKKKSSTYPISKYRIFFKRDKNIEFYSLINHKIKKVCNNTKFINN